jgi:preprotein translocase subunit SecA
MPTTSSEMVADMRHEVIDDMVTEGDPPNSLCRAMGLDTLHAEACKRVLGLDLPVADWAKEEGIAEPEIEERVREAADRKMAEKAANYGPRSCAWRKEPAAADPRPDWKDHLLTLDHLRQGIGCAPMASATR